MADAVAGCWADVDGRSYPCAIVADARDVRVMLFAGSAEPGFEAAGDGRWVRELDAADCDAVEQHSTVCQYRGVPCRVLLIHEDQVFLEYAGTDFPAAGRLGFEQIDRGVYQLWTTRPETSGWTQSTVAVIDRGAPDPARPTASERR